MNAKEQLEFTTKIVNNYFHLCKAKREAVEQKDEKHSRYVDGRIDSLEFVLRNLGIEPDGSKI